MNARHLLIIAAVPGFRASTKMEREDNNAPILKSAPLNLYADLVVAPKVKRVTKNPNVAWMPITPRNDSPSIMEQFLNRPELFQQEYLIDPRPKNGDVDLSKDTVYYDGRWYTAMEARAQLPAATMERLRRAYENERYTKRGLEQPKKRSAPVFKA